MSKKITAGQVDKIIKMLTKRLPGVDTSIFFDDEPVLDVKLPDDGFTVLMNKIDLMRADLSTT